SFPVQRAPAPAPGLFQVRSRRPAVPARAVLPSGVQRGFRSQRYLLNASVRSVRSVICCLIWVGSMLPVFQFSLSTILCPESLRPRRAEKRGMLSRRLRRQPADLFDNQLWRLDSSPLIDVEPVSYPDAPAEGRARLVESNCVKLALAVQRPHLQLEVQPADDPLFNELEVTAPERLRKTCSPGTAVPEKPREIQVHRGRRQSAVA